MVIDEKLLAELAVHNLNYKVVCDLFDLSEKERDNPNCGIWIVEQIKNFQTAYMAIKYINKDTLHPESPRPATMEIKSSE